ncbi:MAG: hypothetical protein AABX83_02665 [Nanoarchaeota archaeon]
MKVETRRGSDDGLLELIITGVFYPIMFDFEVEEDSTSQELLIASRRGDGIIIEKYKKDILDREYELNSMRYIKNDSVNYAFFEKLFLEQETLGI